MPEQRFTFTFSSEEPRKHVRCDGCGWCASGHDNSVFDKADEHICQPRERDITDVLRSDDAMRAFGVERGTARGPG